MKYQVEMLQKKKSKDNKSLFTYIWLEMCIILSEKVLRYLNLN